MTRRKLPHEKLKPGPKPKATVPPAEAAPLSLSSDDSEPLEAPPPVAEQPTEPAAELRDIAVEPPARVAPRWDDPLQRNRSPDLMDEAELRQYGVQIGLSRRDASDLSVDRLRVACKQRVYDLIEEI